MTSTGGSVEGSRFPYGKVETREQLRFTETDVDIPEDSSTRHLIYLIKKLTKRVEKLEALLEAEQSWRFINE